MKAKKEKKRAKKGLATLLSIIICLTVIFGGGYGTLAILKTKALKTSYVGTVSAEKFVETAEVEESSFVKIVKKNKDFVILNITDTHLSDYDYRLFTGYFARRDIKKLVEKIHPDLITMSGDLVCADSEYNSVVKLTEFMNSLKTPWAPIFGNHDGEASNIDKNFLADTMIGDPTDPNNYCLMRKGPSDLGEDENDRVGNYVINIVEKSSSNAETLVQSLFMMDTGRTQLTEKQIAWYRKNVAKVREIYGADAKSTLVVHIPLAEYSFAYMEGYDTKTKQWRDEYKKVGAYGDCYEDVCCDKKKFGNKATMLASEEYKALPDEYRVPAYEDYFLKNGVPVKEGIFKYLKENGTENVLCGHDHLNCFYAPYKGVNLIYSLKNGMGSGYKPGRNGGTILTLTGKTLKVEYSYI